MTQTTKQWLYVSILTLSVILFYCEQVDITHYFPNKYNYIIPLLINPISLLSIPIIKNKGIILGTIIILFAMPATFWGITLLFNFIIVAILTWVASGILLIVQKIFKDKQVYELIQVNIYYGAIALISIAALSLFLEALQEKNSSWVTEHLLLLKLFLAVCLIPIFVWYSRKLYQELIGIPTKDTNNLKTVENSSVIKRYRKTNDNRVIQSGK